MTVNISAVINEAIRELGRLRGETQARQTELYNDARESAYLGGKVTGLSIALAHLEGIKATLLRGEVNV